MGKLNVLLAIYVNLEVLCEEKPLRRYQFSTESEERQKIVKLDENKYENVHLFQTVFLQIEPPHRHQLSVRVWLCSLVQSNESDPFNCLQTLQ